MRWQEPYSGVWSQTLCWTGQCGNRNRIVIGWVSVLASGLVASQVTLSCRKLETGLRSWGGKSSRWRKQPALCDCFYGWLPLKPMSLGGGGPMMRVLGGDQRLTVFKRWSWTLLHSTSLAPEHFYLSICLPYCVVYGALAYAFGLWLPLGSRAHKKPHTSLETLGLNPGYHKITQRSAITVLPSVLLAMFAVLLWCENAELF